MFVEIWHFSAVGIEYRQWPPRAATVEESDEVMKKDDVVTALFTSVQRVSWSLISSICTTSTEKHPANVCLSGLY